MAKKKVTTENLNNITNSYRELQASELRWKCPIDRFNFTDTSQIPELSEIVGQPRAIESIKIGAKVAAKGFNIFVTGLAGTGRLTTVQSILQQVEGYANEFFDYCYVNNFENPDKPSLLKLQQGKGRQFAKAMDDAIIYLRRGLPKLFEEDEYQAAKRKLFDQYQKNENEIINSFDEKIKPRGFIRGQYENEQGIMIPDVFPIIDEKPVHINSLEQLVNEKKITNEQAEAIRETYEILHNEIYDLSRLSFKILQEYKKNLSNLDRTTSEIVINSTFKQIEEIFIDDKIKNYLASAKEHIIKNLALFIRPNETSNTETPDSEMPTAEERFAIYSVNVILDNSEVKNSPIVIETTPSYSNLFGTIEKVYDKRGFWKTDFTKIKAGALLRADQGYLIVNADDLFVEPGVWQSLKRVLLYNKLEMQPYDVYFQISQSYLKPEPIDVNVKVIIIGGQTLYKWLYEYEKGFKKIFKINAQFDYVSENNSELIVNYTKFISKLCREEKLPHLTPDGVAEVIEWASEVAGSQNKLTLRFSDLADLVREASYYAPSDTKLIDRTAIEKANEIRRYRNNLIDEKIQNEILEGSILVDTKGERVGQINGLTIYNDGIFAFGKPARITATVGVGTAGIINVEREAAMSGSIHNKAILIISGFLRERFARKFPLSLSAAIAFEQSYSGIDGDSASLAEIYVLLSAITKMPIKQSFAITGSMNQKGDSQPIGGVNDKIRGYWEICRANGLVEGQGVIIPEQNVKDLMLYKQIQKDVEEGKFHIYSVKTIEDAVPLLFGIEAGRLDENGNYPEGTLFAKVECELEKLYKLTKPLRHQSEAKKAEEKEAIKKKSSK